MLLAPIVRQIRGYNADEWEIFTRECSLGLEGYLEVKRLGGPHLTGVDELGSRYSET